MSNDVGIKTKQELDRRVVVQAYWKHLGLTEFNANQQAEHVGLLKWLVEWIECPDCKGEGKITVAAYYRYTVCYLCGGSKKIQRVNDPKFWRK